MTVRAPARIARPAGARRMREVGASESGQSIVWAAVMLPLLLAVVGLAADGGLVFNARLRLQQVADGAARAGATQVDDYAYRASGGAAIVLDQIRAQRVASDYLAGSGLDLAGTVDADGRRVVVSVTQEAPTGFLRIVGIESVRISASAPSELSACVERGS